MYIATKDHYNYLILFLRKTCMIILDYQLLLDLLPNASDFQ